MAQHKTKMANNIKHTQELEMIENVAAEYCENGC